MSTAVAGEPAGREAAAGGGRPLGGRLLVALLCGLVGFAATVQVRLTEAGPLERADRGDLVEILDGLSERTDRLQAEIAELEASRAQLESGVDRREAALDEATERLRTLAVLAGTAPATGPGVRLVISDLRGRLPAAVLLSAVQEVRDAGAEAIEVAGTDGEQVRIVTSSYFLDSPTGVRVDGVALRPPYEVTAIGDPETLSTALGIPGGVLEEVDSNGGSAEVHAEDQVEVDALQLLRPPRYARPASQSADGSG